MDNCKESGKACTALNPFEYQKPSALATEQIIVFRDMCKTMYEHLMTLSPSRERSVAITKLEEVSMWANKHFAFHVKDEVLSADDCAAIGLAEAKG